MISSAPFQAEFFRSLKWPIRLGRRNNALTAHQD